MDTPFALLVFVVLVAIVAVIVYLSRRSAKSESIDTRLGSDRRRQEPRMSEPPPPQQGGYRPAPADEFGGAEKPVTPPSTQTGSYPAAPPAPAPQPGSAKPGSPPPPPQAAPPPAPVQPKPAPSRSGRGLFEDEEQAKEEMPADEKKVPAPPPRMPVPEPEPVAAPPKEVELSDEDEMDDAIPDWLSEPGTAAPDLAAPGTTPEANPDLKPDASAIPAEDVRFTAYHPKEADVETWYTLLVYAHIEAALAKVQADAAKFKDQMGDIPREARSTQGAQLVRGTELTIVPQMDKVEFNPERISFKWVEDMHRAEFRMKAAKDLAGLAGNGTISIFVGPLIVATIRFGMLFNEKSAAEAIRITSTTIPMSTSTANLYKPDQIFVSYSHKDSPVVLACRDAYKALGYDVLIDVDNLRSGEKWNDALMRMIDRADIFQLFWSKNSAESKYCRQEWEYALKKGKERFIRPVYWEQPLVSPPDELDELHFAYVPLPKKDQ